MRVQQGQWSRRSFLKTTAAGVAAAGVAGSFARIADAADGLRSIGLGVSEINEIQDKATKDLGFPVSGQAMGYGDMFSKMLNQNDQYEIAEGYYNDMMPSHCCVAHLTESSALIWPVAVFAIMISNPSNGIRKYLAGDVIPMLREFMEALRHSPSSRR